MFKVDWLRSLYPQVFLNLGPLCFIIGLLIWRRIANIGCNDFTYFDASAVLGKTAK